MALSVQRVIILLISIRFLAVLPIKVHGLTSADMALRQRKEAQGIVLDNHCILKDASVQGRNADKKLTTLDLVLRQSNKVQGTVPHSKRVLEDVTMQRKNTKKRSARLSKTFDPNQSSKRRVPRGSDPIHNRS